MGSWMIGLGFFYTAYYFAVALLKGKKAPASPWGGLTLEWATSSPPPTENFYSDPVVTTWPYDFRPGVTSSAEPMALPAGSNA
jgi:cytochrome c oxidase subunit 1